MSVCLDLYLSAVRSFEDFTLHMKISLKPVSESAADSFWRWRQAAISCPQAAAASENRLLAEIWRRRTCSSCQQLFRAGRRGWFFILTTLSGKASDVEWGGGCLRGFVKHDTSCTVRVQAWSGVKSPDRRPSTCFQGGLEPPVRRGWPPPPVLQFPSLLEYWRIPEGCHYTGEDHCLAYGIFSQQITWHNKLSRSFQNRVLDCCKHWFGYENKKIWPPLPRTKP